MFGESLTRRKPVRASRPLDLFPSFQSQMDRLFQDFFRDDLGFRARPGMRSDGGFVPELEITETPDEFRVTAELPGLTEDQVEVSLVDNVLTLKGEKHEQSEKQEGELRHSERRYGSFERAVTLPSDVMGEKVEAKFAKGLLTVVLPKAKQATVQSIPIRGE